MQGVAPSGAVRQDTLGKLPDVPVPKNMNSIPVVGCTENGELSESNILELELEEVMLRDGRKRCQLQGFKNSFEKIKELL